jgi:glycosyltransferase involved in cell wall biosynthesis
MRKKMLIIGPISESGGREINTIFFISQFKKFYETTVFSTIPVSRTSIVDQYLGSNKMLSFERIVLQHLFIKVFALATKWKNSSPLDILFLVKNKMSNYFYSFENIYLQKLTQEINQQDIIFYSGLLSDKWLQAITKLCQSLNKTLLISITGSCHVNNKFPKELYHQKIVVHSSVDLELLTMKGFTNVRQIEQSSRLENELLKLDTFVNQPMKFGYLGRMSHEKGLESILATFKNNKSEILMSGTGPLEEDFFKAASFFSNIKNNEYIPYTKIPDFFNQIDVLIISSQHEGGPLVGIEAMAAGKIIISTKVGAMIDRLKCVDKTLFFTVHSDADLTTAVNTILNKSSKELLDIKKKTREYYHTHATNKIVVNHYLDFLNL